MNFLEKVCTEIEKISDEIWAIDIEIFLVVLSWFLLILAIAAALWLAFRFLSKRKTL